MKSFRFLASPLLLLTAGIAQACLWDSDTLAYEAKKFPEVVDAIVGRFERYPAKYYEMRIRRIKPIFESGKATLEQLDDLAVAYDRVGKDTEAILVMAKKAELLKAKPDKEHQYRYYANLGTFQAHQWFHDGANRQKLDLLKAGGDNIAAAIRINPDAHFGREITQLEIIKSIISFDGAKNSRALNEALRSKVREDNPHIKGLIGLIILGNAWESPDAYHLLSNLLEIRRDAFLASLAAYRADELQKAGKKRLPWPIQQSHPGMHVPDGDRDSLSREFKELRHNADEYQAKRLAFMEKQFVLGKHPDTDPDFWKGFEDVPRREVPGLTFRIGAHEILYGIAGLCLTCAVGLMIYKLRKRFGKGKSRAPTF